MNFKKKFSNGFTTKNKLKKTCCLVGIRTQESLNVTIHSDKNTNKYKKSTTKKRCMTMFIMHTIFDWKTSDVWLQIINCVLKMLNELQSPFSTAQESLKLYKVIGAWE
jgi:predicted phosphoadenosine phosphosulfate sulfurtransferase